MWYYTLMPSKNTLKIYQAGGIYHLYNRGVNKMDIFLDGQDYGVFLSYLKAYLLPKDTEKLNKILADPQSSPREKSFVIRELNLNNFHNKIYLIAYCLMPNHYHLLIKQKEGDDMAIFMKSLMTRYTQYFNKRYKRVGPIYQSRYKAVLVTTDEQLLHLTRYIHRNPKRTVLLKQPSSYQCYLGKNKQEWIKSDIVIGNFASSGFNSYQSFVESEDSDLEEQTIATISKIAIDFDS